MKNKVVIVIPVYKEYPDKFEEICLKQCFKVLHDNSIALVSPQGLNVSAYYDIFGKELNVYSFHAKYFKSLQSYNKLLTSIQFYKAFVQYKFMLLYQSDAYVFRNELDYWCDKEYDYIGAPIYEYNGTINPVKYLGIGNGGFSLRNIQTALRVITTFKKIYSFQDLLHWYLKYNWKGKIRYFTYFLRMTLGFGGNSHYLLNYSKFNEDVFWGVYVPNAFSDFKIASFEDSYKFSMEYNCQKLMELNKGQLPFGCHQWYKGSFLDFWKPFIEADSN